MNNLLFGIVIGLFLYFAGSRFLIVAMGALKERKIKEAEKIEETMKMMIDKVMGEMKEKK